VFNVTPRPLYPGQEPRYRLNMVAGWAPDPIWTLDRSDKYAAAMVIRTLDLDLGLGLDLGLDLDLDLDQPLDRHYPGCTTLLGKARLIHCLIFIR
jgi:hypothetical protein